MFRWLFTRIVFPLVIVGAAGFGAYQMYLSKTTVTPTPKPVPPPRVEVVAVAAESRPAVVSGTGIVEAARQMTVVPEVSGRVVYQSPSLTVGGRVKAGEVLVRLDRSAYALALRQQRSQVQQAELERELESGRGELARREWELLQKNSAGEGGPNRLASRQAQAEAAEVGVDAAKGALDRARLDLERTVIRAPFDATVTRETVETGQVVGPGTSLATLVGTGEVWARVALPIDALRLLDVPRTEDELGSPGTVSQRLPGGGEATWEGAVRRLVYELDPDSRMLMVLVAVQDPFEVGDGKLPLLPGAFVTVQLRGQGQAPTLAVPRKSLFEGRRVWTVDADDTLRSRELAVAWGDAEHVFVTTTDEFPDGVRIVTEPPVGAVEGMKIEALDPAGPVATPAATSKENGSRAGEVKAVTPATAIAPKVEG